jgi:hypothetical protein
MARNIRDEQHVSPSTSVTAMHLTVMQVTAFKSGNKWRILIASYESIRKHCDMLQGCIDLLICDEGHRLKSSGGNNTMTALRQLNCVRRIILTGTPVQNNLKECAADPLALSQHNTADVFTEACKSSSPVSSVSPTPMCISSRSRLVAGSKTMIIFEASLGTM